MYSLSLLHNLQPLDPPGLARLPGPPACLTASQPARPPARVAPRAAAYASLADVAEDSTMDLSSPHTVALGWSALSVRSLPRAW